MTLVKQTSARELEIVGLIDIIFLLIIFGIVLAAFGGEEDVPGAEGQTKQYDYFMFKIDQKTVLSNEDTPGNTPVYETRYQLTVHNAPFPVLEEDLFFPREEDIVSGSMTSFANNETCQALVDYVGEYANYLRDEENESAPQTIRVEVHSETPIRVLNFIAQACAVHRDPIFHLDAVTLVEQGG